MPYYICSLPNPGTKGIPNHLITEDRAELEAFAKREDRPGRGVYECINPLIPGATRRCLETVAELRFIYFDLDLQNIETNREEAIRRLKHLPFEFTWVHDSGSGNLHVGIEIKDPPLPGTPEYDQTIALWKRLVEKLAADPAPAHPAALIRALNTHNTKDGNTGLCHQLWNGGAPQDITDLEAFDDLLVEPLFAYKEEPDSDTNDGREEGGHKPPIDVDARLAAMCWHGQGDSCINVTQRDVMASLIAHGVSLDEATATVLDATRKCVADDPQAAGWDWQTEELNIAYSGARFINKNPQYADQLPDDLRTKFEELANAGKHPAVSKNRSGLYVRAARGCGDSTEHTGAANEETKPEDKRARGPLVKTSLQFTTAFTPPDYIIDNVLQRRFLYSLTAKTGDGKTAFALLIVYCVGTQTPLGIHETERGRCCILAGENPDDVRMRWIAMGEELKFDHTTIPVDFIEGVFPLGQIKAVIEKKAAETGSEYSLVVVDSSAAYFPGDEENNNAQLGRHARMLRTLTTLPGGPCVIVTCHPTKSADVERLLPRGGGAFVNEVDGNLVCVRRERTFEVHWHEKFRGPDFDPMPFKLQEITAEGLKDSKGRHIPSVMATAMSDQELASHREKAREDENKILRTLLNWEGKPPSLSDLATSNEWLDRLGLPNKSRARHTIDRLTRAKLVRREREDLMLTEAGEKAAKKLT